MTDGDWRSQPLTWALLREHTAPWFKRHRFALSIGLVVAVIIWIICKGIAGIGNFPIPKGAQLAELTNYAQAYDIYKLGDAIILDRVRLDGDGAIMMAGFGLTWWIIYLIQEYRLERKQRGISKASFLILNALFGLYFGWVIYVYAFPSFLILIHPQQIILDPSRDLVLLDEQPLGRMSSILEFEGVEKEGYHYDWTWFGVKLKDGRYYSFNEGQMIGANVQLIAAYLNTYLKQHPPVQATGH